MVVRRSVKLAAPASSRALRWRTPPDDGWEALLAGVTPADAATYGSVALLAVVMTIAGTIVPALRAMRIDPIESLRAE